MDATALREAAVTDSYEDVVRLIRSTVHHFVRQYGGDFDDMMADANLVFMDAYKRWNPTLGPFHKHVGYLVWAKLFDAMRARVAKAQRHHRESLDPDMYQHKPQRTMGELMEELSRDAQVVVQLTMEAPPEMSVLFNPKGHLRKTPRKEIRKRIRSALLGMGWTIARIAESFEEVARVASHS